MPPGPSRSRRIPPVAIVELGFVGGDRELLTARQDEVARGIAGGVVAFLTAESVPPRTTPTASR